MSLKKLFFSFFLLPYLIFGQEIPINGVQESKHEFIALTNAEIIISPDKKIKSGYLLIKGDKIYKVGKKTKFPKGTKVIDCKKAIIMPSFIDTYSDLGLLEKRKTNRNRIENTAYYWNEAIHPEIDASLFYFRDNKNIEKYQKMGYGTISTHIADGIVRGTGTLINLSDKNTRHQIEKNKTASYYSLKKGSSKQKYPSSQMGSIALLKQAYFDYYHFIDSKKENNISFNHWKRNYNLPQFFKVDNVLELLRAYKFEKLSNAKFIYVGGGDEYNAIDKLKKLKPNLVIPLNYPKGYEISDPYIAKKIPLKKLKQWELAPSNASILKNYGVSFSFTAHGVDKAKSFWKNIRKTIQRGLSEEQMLKALTIEPARQLNLSSLMGSLSPGKYANLCIYKENPFQQETTLLSSWNKGLEKKWEPLPIVEALGEYQININGIGLKIKIKDKKISFSNDSIGEKLSFETKNEDITIRFVLNDSVHSGLYLLHGKIKTNGSIFEGDALLPNGSLLPWNAYRTKENKKPNKNKPISDSTKTTHYINLWSPNMAYGHDSLPKAKKMIFKNVTIWTNEKEGKISGSVVIENGKIKSVIKGNKKIPEENAIVINGEGKHLTSGIIDEHSHIAISKGVNESGQAISAEVSIGDVVNSNDINIYRQLAGGVTASQLLHGSANPIGGQSALIKLKWGYLPEEMLIPNAPKFIKFALGENVKQSNWGDANTTRFPQTRMGVEQIYYDAFNRAKNYKEQWAKFNLNKKGIAPRKDLELITLNEILDGKRNITCHSYSQSEINMLMHVADSMGIKINTFTHILEGYKLADKMKSHGAAASTFSDWWAYKYEVNDAIPHNASLLHKQGVLVAINSDDAEMGRRLNQEAAKAIKYGGMSEEDAWKMITLNPAKMLHLDNRMGSIKEGKDADLVLWSNHPLSIKARAEKTIIDGILFYDIKDQDSLIERNRLERIRILTLMMNEKNIDVIPFTKKESHPFHCNTIGEIELNKENLH